MRKAVLVLEMPSSCDECPLFGSHYSDMTCKANGRSINYPYPKDERQDWCPLRELPVKKDSMNLNSIMEKCKDRDSIMDSVLKQFIVDGYNACIDELLKGEEG